MQYHLEAEYESGFVLVEDAQDHSPYDASRNIFHAILNKRPEKAHGKLVRLSLVGPEHTYNIDWTKLPDNARPIRFKDMEADTVGGTITDVRTMQIRFGYQYNDDNGENVQEITTVK